MKKLYNPRTIAQLQVEFPYNDWLSYINRLLPSDVQVDANETIVVGDYKFFKQLGELLEETSDETIANYIVWRILIDSIEYLPQAFRERDNKFNNIYQGTEGTRPRWEKCITESLGFLPFALSGLYIRKHFDEDTRLKASEMVTNIKNEFINMLEANTWMDKATKEQAKTKAKNIYVMIGYPEWLMDEAGIEKYYEKINVTINEKLYFESVLQLSVVLVMQEFRKLREPIDRHEWPAEMNPTVTNAGYSPLHNALYLPAATLQDVFFNSKRPQYVNYGGAGCIIGHEITHGKIFV